MKKKAKLLLKMWHYTIVALLLTMSTQALGTTYLTSLDQVESGKYYRFYSLSYNATMAMSETTTGSNNVFCDTPDENDYMQVWKIVVSASTETSKTVTIQNAVSERWINRSSGNFHTWPTGQDYTIQLTADGFTIANGGGFHHQQNGHDVVSYSVTAAASKWQLEEVTINETALNAQKEEYNNYINLVNNKSAITTALAKYFTDASCSELNTTYQGYSDEALSTAMAGDGIPQTVISMALKVKKNTWEIYHTDWDHTEKTFRIGSYAPVSKESVWRSLVKVGYALSPNSDPTGICVAAGDIITVYVGNIPSNGTIMLRNVQHQSATGDGYTLATGFNVLKMQTAGCLFVDYEVNNTTNGTAPFTKMSNYSNVTLHIEGGKVNGAFYATRGDDNEDWTYLQQYLFGHYDYLQLRSRQQIFNMRADYVKSACPTNMQELLDQWDQVVEMEHNIMGLDDEFGGYFNTPMMAVSFDGSGHMYASTYGTYYNENTISDVMKYENLFAGGSLWGPAHEIGHINQAAINIIGQSEVSNNLFSNIAVFLNGHLTSRAEYISTTFQNMANNVYWQDRGIWERTHLYFQLYQFFHVRGYNETFYQDFFKALRANPTSRTQNVLTNATDDYLKFYKMACQVSGYDLTEFFQAYGFFVVPTLSSYIIGGEEKQAFWVGDYGTYYLYVTQKMIEDAIEDVKKMTLPKANIIFIEDRITAPDATYNGAEPGTKKTAFSGYPFGNGDVGQYTDFVSETSATGYTASYVENHEGDLDVLIGHESASGAVGFKVYDANNQLVYLANTYSFTVPKKIFDKIKGTAFKIVAAGANGSDQEMETNNDFVEWVVKDENGTVLKKHFQLTTNGQNITAYPDELQAAFVTLPTFTPFTYTTGMDKEKKIVATVNTPFKSSSEAQAYYYNIQVRNGYLCQKISGEVSTPELTKIAESDLTSDAYKWAFYGNPYTGYRIKNLATGQWLCTGPSTSNGAHPTLSSTEATDWKVDYFNFDATNAPQFQLSVPGTTRYLNDYGGNGNNIAYYGNASFVQVSTDYDTVDMPTISINPYSHLSSYSYSSPLVVPEDVNIFIVTTTDTYDNTVTVQWLDTKVIPANTGVLLYSDGGGEKTLSLGAWVDDEVTGLYADNLLKSTATSGFTVGAAQSIYALRKDQTAFAKVQTGVSVPKNKAYLDVTPNAARTLTINFGNTATGIKEPNIPSSIVDNEAVDSPLYNVNGQRVSHSYKGIVIHHGIKKVQR